MIFGVKCDGCMSEEHHEALDLATGMSPAIAPGPEDTDEPYGRVMACVERKIEKPENRGYTLESVVKECVIRETGIPFD